MEDGWSLVGPAFGDKIHGEANMTNSISVLWYSGDKRYKKTSDSFYQPTLAKRGKMPAQPFLLKDRSKAEDVFCSLQTSEQWTDIHDREVTKWQEPSPPAGSPCIFSQEDGNLNHKVSEPANKDYCGPASVQSVKNLPTSNLPAYNM